MDRELSVVQKINELPEDIDEIDGEIYIYHDRGDNPGLVPICYGNIDYSIDEINKNPECKYFMKMHPCSQCLALGNSGHKLYYEPAIRKDRCYDGQEN
jgi:hypothetical protein